MNTVITTTPAPKKNPNPLYIYVACVSSYEAGIWHGVWIDATQDEDYIAIEISAMLVASPIEDAEEWAVYHYHGFYNAGDMLGQYPDTEGLVTAARLIRDYGENAAAVMNYWRMVDKADKDLRNRYLGSYRTLADYAREYCRQQGMSIPGLVEDSIDYRKLGQKLKDKGDIYTIYPNENVMEVLVFRNS